MRWHSQILYLKRLKRQLVKKYSIKVGIMDEERRTTVKKRVYKTGKKSNSFYKYRILDRTGDEMHTSFEAGI